MVTIDEVMATVDDAFTETSRGLVHWPDPHDRGDGRRDDPDDDAYSRYTDPGRWRIVAARAEAWITTLVEIGLGRAERNVAIGRAGEWFGGTPASDTTSIRIVPTAADALPIVIDLPGSTDLPDGRVAVSIGIGDPAVQIELIPDCGCDACDDGSQPALDQIDDILAGLITSDFRQIRRTMEPGHPWGPRHQSITEFADRRSGHNVSLDRRAGPFDPSDGWVELTGRPWITTATAPC